MTKVTIDIHNLPAGGSRSQRIKDDATMRKLTDILLASTPEPPDPDTKVVSVAWPGREFCEIAERNVTQLAKFIKGKDEKEVVSDAGLALRILLGPIAPPAAKPEVQVAGLVWEDYERGRGAYANTILGLYHVWDFDGLNGHYRIPWADTGILIEGGSEVAKAAAFAHYSARILSALVSEGKP